MYYYILFCVFCISFIFAYGRYRCKKTKGKKKFLFLDGNHFFKIDSINFVFDKWSLTHIWFFFILGYFYPKTFLISMILGIIWEFVEFYLGRFKPKWFFDEWRFGGCPSENNDTLNEWWFYRWNDILMNLIGFLIGKHLFKKKKN